MNKLKKIIAAALVVYFCFSMLGCETAEQTSDISDTSSDETKTEITPVNSDPVVEYSSIDEAKTEIAPVNSDPVVEYGSTDEAVTAFSTKLFKDCCAQAPTENALVSPISVYSALTMVGSGAKGDTLSEMEHVLGGSSFGIDSISQAVRDFTNSSDNNILNVANSMFIIKRDDIAINEDFKNTLSSDFGAEIFNEPCEPQTIDLINNWTKEKTHDMIPSILNPDALTPDTVSFFLNAVAFEGEWVKEYESGAVFGEEFTAIDGTIVTSDFLHSEEHTYIESDHAIGFIKPYKSEGDCEYFFAAILPNEGIDINDYISSMTPQTFNELIGSQTNTAVSIKLPKFTFDSTYKLKNTLSQMGMPSAFNGGDFSGISADSDIAIGEVLHKTHIELDEKGTKAAAVTAIDTITNAMAADPIMPKEIYLTRPFVFMIYSSANNYPIFIGRVCDPI